MDKDAFTEKMRKYPLFQGLEFEEMQEILSFAKFKSYKVSEEVVRENDLTDVFFIVETGRLEVFISNTPGNAGIAIKEIKLGELCGEMSLLGIEKRTASIRAKDESLLLIWNAVDCLDYFRKNKNAGYVVMKNLSAVLGARVRDMNLLLRNYADSMGPVATKYL